MERPPANFFIGREREIAELNTTLDQAIAGRGGLLLLSGEPGIGKTRLADQCTTFAQDHGVQTLWGRCWEGDGAPAFWPWVQVVREFVQQRDPETLREQMGVGASDIARVVPELQARLPDVHISAGSDSDQARFHFFDSLTTFLKNAAQAQPMLLVLDDLHWADAPSLLLLQFLARTIQTTPLCVIGTYRDVEVATDHPLSDILAGIARESRSLPLDGLSEPEVEQFIQHTTGSSPPKGDLSSSP